MPIAFFPHNSGLTDRIHCIIVSGEFGESR